MRTKNKISWGYFIRSCGLVVAAILLIASASSSLSLFASESECKDAVTAEGHAVEQRRIAELTTGTSRQDLIDYLNSDPFHRFVVLWNFKTKERYLVCNPIALLQRNPIDFQKFYFSAAGVPSGKNAGTMDSALFSAIRAYRSDSTTSSIPKVRSIDLNRPHGNKRLKDELKNTGMFSITDNERTHDTALVLALPTETDVQARIEEANRASLAAALSKPPKMERGRPVLEYGGGVPVGVPIEIMPRRSTPTKTDEQQLQENSTTMLQRPQTRELLISRVQSQDFMIIEDPGSGQKYLAINPHSLMTKGAAAVLTSKKKPVQISAEALEFLNHYARLGGDSGLDRFQRILESRLDRTPSIDPLLGDRDFMIIHSAELRDDVVVLVKIRPPEDSLMNLLGQTEVYEGRAQETDAPVEEQPPVIVEVQILPSHAESISPTSIEVVGAARKDAGRTYDDIDAIAHLDNILETLSYNYPPEWSVEIESDLRQLDLRLEMHPELAQNYLELLNSEYMADWRNGIEHLSPIQRSLVESLLAKFNLIAAPVTPIPEVTNTPITQQKKPAAQPNLPLHSAMVLNLGNETRAQQAHTKLAKLFRNRDDEQLGVVHRNIRFHPDAAHSLPKAIQPDFAKDISRAVIEFAEGKIGSTPGFKLKQFSNAVFKRTAGNWMVVAVPAGGGYVVVGIEPFAELDKHLLDTLNTRALEIARIPNFIRANGHR